MSMGASVAVAMISTAAYAQSVAGANLATGPATGQSGPSVSLADRQAVAREIPWYERFSSSAVPSTAYGDLPQIGEGTRLSVAPSARWGVSLDTRRQGVSTLRSIRDEAAVSAYYQFTPRFRVGGRLSVAEQVASGTAPAESTSSVRIESAFKF